MRASEPRSLSGTRRNRRENRALRLLSGVLHAERFRAFLVYVLSFITDAEDAKKIVRPVNQCTQGGPGEIIDGMIGIVDNPRADAAARVALCGLRRRLRLMSR